MNGQVHQQRVAIGPAQREALLHHPGAVIWLTGLSGAGKSSIANALEVLLHRDGVHTCLLDGDNLRLGLNCDLGFTDTDRVENIRRVAEVARLMQDAGLVVICAVISPFARAREAARARIGAGRFIEVFIDTPLATCEARDPKGLYRRARAGLIAHFTGISSPYEAPREPEVHIDGATTTSADAAAILAGFLRTRWESVK